MAESVSKKITKGFRGKGRFPESELYQCVNCGFCLESCPTYIETGLETESPRGRISLMKAANEGRIELNDNVISHWDMCLQCRACETACPSGVKYGYLMENTKLILETSRRKTFLKSLLWYVGILIINKRSLLYVLGNIIKFYQKSGIQLAIRTIGLKHLLPEKLKKIEQNIPTISTNFFHPNSKTYMPSPNAETKGKVSILAGCVMCITDSQAIESTIRVLTRNGYEVQVPKDQQCCGALQMHAGYKKTTVELAKNNIDVLMSNNPDFIVSCSAGCGAQLKSYDHLFEEKDYYYEKSVIFSNITKDIHELLVEIGFKKPVIAIDSTVTYQDPCHMVNVQKIYDSPRKILKSIPGLNFVETTQQDMCCGAAGTYSITQPTMSEILGKKKAKVLINTKSHIIATSNPGCAIQLRSSFERLKTSENQNVPEVNYVIELLDRAYGNGE